MAEKDSNPSWKNVEERMAQKLVQLTKLMEHFGSHPSEGSDAFAEQNDSEIEEILKETSSRIRVFKDELETKRQDKTLKEAIKNAKDKERSLREAAEQQCEAVKREMLQLRSELGDQAEKLRQNALSSKQQLHNIQEMKLHHAQEIEAERKKLEEEVAIILKRSERQVEATKEMLVQRDLQSQDEARKDIIQSLEVLKAVHAEEIEHMKMENTEYIRQLHEKHAAAESRQKEQEAAIEKELEGTIQERQSLQQEVHNLRDQLREAHDMVQATSASLVQDRETKNALQISYSALKNENSVAMEKLRVSLKDVQTVSTTLDSEKKRTMEMKSAYTSTISALESKTLALQKEVGNLTTACALNEDELKQLRKKVDELQLSLASSRKDHSTAATENRRLQEEIRATKDVLSKSEVEMRRKEADACTKSNALSAEISALQLERLAQSEQSANHVKELMELKLKQQISNHELTMNSVQRAFLMQLDEQKKGAQVQVASVEESLRKKWKQSEAKAKEDYAKFAYAFESRLEQQRAKSTELVCLYETKVCKLQDELESLATTGDRLEIEFAGLQKLSLKQAQLSKQVLATLTRQLKDSQRKCEHQQQSLTALYEQVSQSEARIVEQAASIADLKTVLDQNFQAATLSAAQERSCSAEIRELKETLLRTQLEHENELEVAVQNHKMEMLEVRKELEGRKEAGSTRLQEAMKVRFDRETAELHSKIIGEGRRHEQIILEQQATISEATERHNHLVLAHQLDLEMLEGLRRENQAHREALTAAMVDMSERGMADLEHQRHQFSIELEDMAERHSQKMVSCEKLWRAKLELKESKESRKHEADLAEFRQTTRRWHALEKDKIVAENKRTVSQLECHIGGLERAFSHKELRIAELVAAHQLVEEKLSSAQAESRRNQALLEKSVPAEQVSRSLEEQRSEMQGEFALRSDELQSQYAAELDGCRERHKIEVACVQRELETSKASMNERLQTMQSDFDKLQDRFHSKESSPADVLLIGDLQRACENKDAQYQKLSEEARTLRLEILNREENYNKVFGNSPTVLHGVVDWLKPKKKGTTPSKPTLKRLNSPHSTLRTPEGTPTRTPDGSSSRTPEGTRRTSFEQ